MTGLISVQHLKQFLPVRDGNTNFDQKLLTLIESVSKQIEQACRRTFLKQEINELFHSLNCGSNVYDFGGSSDTGITQRVTEQILLLKGINLDLAEDFILRYDTYRVFDTDTVLAQGSDFFIDEENCRVIVSYPTRACRMSFKATYTAGYEEDADEGGLIGLPEDIRMACVLQCIYVWNKTIPENTSVANERDGSIRGTYFTIKGGLLPDAQALLAPYRRMLAPMVR